MSLLGIFALGRRLVAFRWKAAALLAVIALVGGLSAGALAATFSSSRDAYLAGQLSNRGGTTDSVVQAPKEFRAALNRLDGSVGVASLDVEIVRGERTTDATEWVTASSTQKLHYVIQGRRPTGSREISVSQPVADSLGVKVGADVSVNRPGAKPQAMRLVGVTINPDDPGATFAQSVDPGVAADNVNFWIVSPSALAQLKMDERLKEPFRNGNLAITSNRVLLDTASENLPTRVALLRTASWAAGLTFASLIVLVLANLVRVVRRDVDGLTAAGMLSGDAWRIVVASGVVVLGLPALAGGLAGAPIAGAAAPILESAVNQQWGSVSTSWFAVLSFTWWATVCGPTMLWTASRSRALAHQAVPRARAQAGRKSLTAPLGALGLVTVGAAFSPVLKSGYAVIVGAAGLALVGASVSALFGRLLASPLPRASRHSYRDLTRSRLGFTVCAYFLASVSGGYAALIAFDATAVSTINDEAQLQPSGSLLAQPVPDSSIEPLRSAYRDNDGNSMVVYQIPTASNGDLRVVAKSSPEGGLGTRETVAYVAFDERLGPDEIKAQPALISADGFIQFVMVTDLGSKELDEFETSPAPGLGGNLPGVLISPQGTVAKELGIRPTGSSIVGFLDFSELSLPGAARVRNDIQRYSPSALTSDSDDVDPLDDELAVSGIASIFGVALVSVVDLAAAAASLLAYRRFRRILVALNANLRFRVSALVPLAGADVLGAAVVAVGTVLLVRAFSTAPEMGSVGMVWVAPLCILVVANAGFAMTYTLSKPRAIDG